MKKLKKIGKIAIPAVSVVAAGAGAVQTYGDYNKTDGTLMLQNIEAMTALYDNPATAKEDNGKIAKVRYHYGDCVMRAQLNSIWNYSDGHWGFDGKAFRCEGGTSATMKQQKEGALSGRNFVNKKEFYWKVPSGIGQCSKEEYGYYDDDQWYGACYRAVY